MSKSAAAEVARNNGEGWFTHHLHPGRLLSATAQADRDHHCLHGGRLDRLCGDCAIDYQILHPGVFTPPPPEPVPAPRPLLARLLHTDRWAS